MTASGTTAPAGIADGCHLVEAFVDKGLNGGQPDMVDELFSTSFRDHDPLQLPSAPPSAGMSTIRDVRAIIEFLARPEVDIVFHLEDVFGTGDRVGYRLFGQGTIELPEGSPLVGGPLGRVDANPVLGNRLHVEYRSTGVFRLAAGRLVERWGPVVIS